MATIFFGLQMVAQNPNKIDAILFLSIQKYLPIWYSVQISDFGFPTATELVPSAEMTFYQLFRLG